MMFLSLFQVSATEALIAYVLIGLFALSGMILITIELVRRIRFDSYDLSDEIRRYTRESKVSDERVMLDYVDSYFSRTMLAFDEIIRFLISSLTILGLLGTFIGLAVLIVPQFENLRAVVSTGNVSEIAFKDTFRIITDGFKTAFNTSILGIICSLVLSGLYHILRQNIRAIRSQFTRFELPGLIAETKKETLSYDPVEFYHEIQNYFIDGLRKFGDTAAKNQAEFKQWSETVVKSHTEAVKTYVESNNNTMKEVLDELGKEYKALKQVSKDNLRVSEVLGSLIDKLDAFADVIRNYDKTYENLLGQIENFSTEFANVFSRIQTVVELTTQPSNLLTNLYTAISTMVNNQHDLLTGNKAMMEGFRANFEELLQSSSARNDANSEKFQTILTDLLMDVQTVFSPDSVSKLLDPRFEMVKNELVNLSISLGTLNSYGKSLEKMGAVESSMQKIRDLLAEKGAHQQEFANLEAQLKKINDNLGRVFEALEF